MTAYPSRGPYRPVRARTTGASNDSTGAQASTSGARRRARHEGVEVGLRPDHDRAPGPGVLRGGVGARQPGRVPRPSGRHEDERLLSVARRVEREQRHEREDAAQRHDERRQEAARRRAVDEVDQVRAVRRQVRRHLAPELLRREVPRDREVGERVAVDEVVDLARPHAAHERARVLVRHPKRRVAEPERVASRLGDHRVDLHHVDVGAGTLPREPPGERRRAAPEEERARRHVAPREARGDGGVDPFVAVAEPVGVVEVGVPVHEAVEDQPPHVRATEPRVLRRHVHAHLPVGALPHQDRVGVRAHGQRLPDRPRPRRGPASPRAGARRGPPRTAVPPGRRPAGPPARGRAHRAP